jgi:hypothetical protein
MAAKLAKISDFWAEAREAHPIASENNYLVDRPKLQY